jgi:hypothetical protein
MKVRMFSAYGLVAAMAADCEELPNAKKRVWSAKPTKTQRAAIELYKRLIPQQSKFDRLFPSTCAVSDDGSSILLQSDMAVDLKWTHTATLCDLRHGKGIELTQDFVIYGDDTAVITTKTGTKLWLCKGSPKSDTAFDLHDHCLEVMSRAKKKQAGFTKLRIPQLNKSCHINFKNLIGMSVNGVDTAYNVSDCKQANKFSLDLQGVKAASNTKIVLTKSIQRIFTIDGPFTAFLVTSTFKEPYFTISVR